MLFLVALLFSKLQTFLNNNPEGNPLKSVYLTPKIALKFRRIGCRNGRLVTIAICFSHSLFRATKLVFMSNYSYCLALPCLAYPVVSVDRWGTTDDLATSSLHSSRLSAFLMAAPSVKPVHSGMLSSHLFLCLPRLLPHWTVPCMTVLASPVDLVMWPYHLSFRCLTVVRRSSCGPMA